MKVKLTYKPEISELIIDLEDYGYDKDVTWDILTLEEKNEITDEESARTRVFVKGENYDF